MSVKEMPKVSSEVVFAVAREMYDKGPGYAQESVALREAAERLGLTELEEQQQLLLIWHQLFRDGKLVLGYDIDNPSRPFFHIPAAARNEAT